jgi:hypothetical protein
VSAVIKQDAGAVLEQVLIKGDLSQLKPEERVLYYKKVCESQGLNPLTKPFEYIMLNGKLRLYALRDCTDQLRKINGVSITIRSREVVEGCYVVTASATDKTGRYDESIGAVPIDGLKGEGRSNALMKCETKAKRRVTLSICGMGWLDESEIDSIPGAETGLPSAPITPTTGALEALSGERQEVVVATAAAVRQCLTEDRPMDAYALCETSGFDNGEKVALWSLLDSKARAVLKRMAAAETSAEEGIINAPDKKRLEARIREYKIDREQVKAYCKKAYGKEHFSELTPAELTDLEGTLAALKEEQESR